MLGWCDLNGKRFLRGNYQVLMVSAKLWLLLFFSAEVPNLSLTMYPFSIPTDEHVPLQHFNR